MAELRPPTSPINPPARPGQIPGLGQARPVVPVTPVAPPKAGGRGPQHDTSSLSLVEESDSTAAVKITSFGGGHAAQVATDKYKRKLNANGSGATRVRTFHARLSDEGLAFMDERINQWCDEHPDMEIKFVTSNIGLYEGKIKEPALILNVWY